MARSTNDRIIIVLIVGLGGLGILWGRCVWLQAIEAPRYAALADAEHYTKQLLRAQRGTIYDRAGRVLAVSLTVPSVYANARGITAKSAIAQQLSRAVDRDATMIQHQLQKDKGFVWVARQVDPSVMPRLVTLRDDGVGVVEEMKRSYPNGPLAAHVLGCVDIDQRGLEGLELTMNHVLQGRDGARSTLRDAKGDLLLGPWTNQVQPEDGNDVVLTIDGVVQQVAEETLAWGVEQYHAKGGSVIVMEPDTGAILAMATQPTYDPNAPGAAPAANRRNRAVTDLFEPGSTFKVVTASALLEEHRMTPEEPIFCENGSYPTVAHHVLHDHKPHGTLSFHDVIAFSSNIGTSKAAQRLKPDELARYIRAFGFGCPTGSGLPGEIGGIVNPPSRWSKLSPFIVPIGQEVAVTPIQLAVMTSVIANGGCRVRPYVVERIQTPEGRVLHTHARVAPRRILSPETVRTVQAMLVSVVQSGTGVLANVQGLTVAGKTGTAQKLEPNGRYSHSRYVASFVGFGPLPSADVPVADVRHRGGGARFVVAVCIDEPRPLFFGGTVAAPLFKRIVERLGSYWGLERQPVSAATPSPQLMGRP